ncbi:neutral zinc metallopeptidase [Streptosporangium sp. CA-115845]|uniref:neutral zinc metallopeptidase n=1 Tax=Streptosporangium sp. CA-115845 TaxID=3240071 RepID=UPI003D91EDED
MTFTHLRPLLRVFAILVILGSLTGCLSAGDQGEAPASDPPEARPGVVLASPSISPRSAALKSPLYRTPPIAKIKCKLPLLEEDSWGSMRRYMQAVSGCLDRVWARQFAKMHASYTPPKRKYLAKRIKTTACDGLTPPKGAYGVYCPSNKTYYVLADRSSWASYHAFWAAHLVAHEHSHYIQDLVSILNYHAELDTKARNQQDRLLAENRLEDQAGCFAAAALQAMRDTLPSWSEFISMYRSEKDLKLYGVWLDRGHNGGRLGSCNTWTAPMKKIG